MRNPGWRESQPAIAQATSEIKERNWAQNKAATAHLPVNNARTLKGNTLAFDGRLRANFSEQQEGQLDEPRGDATPLVAPGQ